MSRHFGSVGGNRNSQKATIFVFAGVALVVICLTVALLTLYSGAQASSAKPAAAAVQEVETIKMIDVLVPNQDIDSGVALESRMFKREPRPQIGVSPRVVVDFEELKGQFARGLIIAGQPLHRDLITSVRPSSAITASIPEGYRAITISTDARSSVEGFVRPGSRVDVLWISTIRGAQGVTRIVQNARVLSAERQINPNQQPGAPVPSTVTLLVTADDAAKINLAMTSGSITLQLRGDSDVRAASSGASITISDLLGNSGPTAVANDCSGSVKMEGVSYCVKRDGSLEVQEPAGGN